MNNVRKEFAWNFFPTVCSGFILLMLLSSSIAASFAPSSVPSLLPPRRISTSLPISIIMMKGGSSDEIPAGQEASSDQKVTEEEVVEQASAAVATSSLLGPNAPPPGYLRKTFPTFPWHSVPNLLTYCRCIAIPALCALFYAPGRHIETASIFAVASMTDWLDGYLARRWDITSPFGAFLDPVADKLMVSTALILLAGRYGAIVAIPTCIILARELAVSALREWMAQRGNRDAVKVGMQGKVKTAATMVALTLLLLVPSPVPAEGFGNLLYKVGLMTLHLCTVITVTSGSVYFRAAAPVLMGKS